MRRIQMITACVFLVFLLMGCSEDVLERNGGKGEGRLILSGIEVKSVVGDVLTKAALEDDVIPSAEEFAITIADASTEEVVKVLEPGAMECLLEAGEYVVKAAYGEEAGLSEIPYFYDEANVTIAAGEAKSVSLTATLACAVLRPMIAENLEAQYDSFTLTVSETVDDLSGEPCVLESGKDFFVRGGQDRSYNLVLSGWNKLGEEVSHTWSYSDLVVRTRYIIQCDPDLPAFTLPEQPEGNVWSKFMYVTPMTAENMTAHKEDMADKVIANVVYEASADNGVTWLASEKTTDDRHVIKGLEPSTTYMIRSRFGGVLSSNTQTVTTESAQGIANGDMETWSNNSYTTYGLKTIYLYYVGTSSSDKSWGTRNSLTMDGVSGGTSSGTSNQITAYRWNSCTIPTSDAVSGIAAEIRTMALSTKPIKGTEVGSGLFWSNNNVANFVKSNHRVYSGYLYTGASDVTVSDEVPDEYGISHVARPVSLSFSYKYSPFNGDKCSIYAKVYDAGKNEITTTRFDSNLSKDTYETVTLKFNYSDINAKAAFIFIMFKSGENEDWNYVQYKAGSYEANPWSLDTFVGSVLKIDNVTLNYDYE